MKIEIKDLVKNYNGQQVLAIDELHLDGINTLAIVGPSGGGKSTLLNILATIEEGDQGYIKINDVEILGTGQQDEYLNEVGFVFQSNNLFPNLTVIDNVTIHLIHTHKMGRQEAIQLAEQWLDKVGLLEHKDKKINQISGGQAQRVAIVRALVSGAKLILLDEPTSALDPELAYDVMMTLMKVRENADIITITHELNFARQFADYYLFIDESQIIAHGPINELFESDNQRVRAFVNKIEFK